MQTYYVDQVFHGLNEDGSHAIFKIVGFVLGMVEIQRLSHDQQPDGETHFITQAALKKQIVSVSKTILYARCANTYISTDAKVVVRRELGKTPNGNHVNGRWVLRVNEVFSDVDQYRNDLAERHNLELKD